MTRETLLNKSACCGALYDRLTNIHRYQAIAIGKKIEKLKVDKRIAKN
jgi:hypothetical protein